LTERAGVAIIIKIVDGSKHVLFVKRSAAINDPWAGHIAFPGGHFKQEDKTILNTVVREVLEETGIDLKRYGKLLFILPIATPRNRPELKVYPYVFSLDEDIKPKCGEEIEACYWIPLESLRESDVEFGLGDSRRVIKAYVYRYGRKEVVIWGLTKRILDNLIMRIGGE